MLNGVVRLVPPSWRHDETGDGVGLLTWFLCMARADDTVLADADGTTATTVGAVPPLSLYMGTTETRVFCSKNVALTDLSPVARQFGGWFTFEIPLSDFNCPDLSTVDQFGIQNQNSLVARFCLDNIRIGASTAR